MQFIGEEPELLMVLRAGSRSSPGAAGRLKQRRHL